MSQRPVEIARMIANTLARPHAISVDREGRFPIEVFDALAKHRLLGTSIDSSEGGLGCAVTEIAAVCTELGRACTSSANIYAVHQTQALGASATSEVGVAGDLRTSHASLRAAGDRIRLDKRCSTISYFRHADAVLVTARLDPSTGSDDQVIGLVRRSDWTAEAGPDLDMLGMRGTCTLSVDLRAYIPACQLLPASVAVIASTTMVRFSYVTWAAGWLGLAHDAFDVVNRRLVDEAARSAKLPIGARTLESASSDLHILGATVRDAAAEFARLSASPEDAELLCSVPYVRRFNHLKLRASELTSSVCRRCMQGRRPSRLRQPFAVLPRSPRPRRTLRIAHNRR